MSAAPTRCGEILLVEDSLKDARLICEALSEQGHRHHLQVARNGEEALHRLRGEVPYADNPRPDLVLLDVNLPNLSGIEVLSCIKCDPALKHLPVLMLSTSRAERDVADSYAHHANGYLVKPASYDEFAALIELTLEFWLEHAQPPPRQSTS
ncbi:MAG: response regulator [Pseudomonadota bacterium]